MNTSAHRVVPLLPEQRRFLTRGLPGAHHWNQVALYSIPGELTADLVASAMRWVVNRHEGLRLRLGEDGGTSGTGVVEPELEQFPVDDVDLSSATDPDALTAYCTRAQESLRLDQAPMIRVSRIAWRDNSFRLLMVVHHYVADGVGFGVLAGEFETACRALLAGHPFPEAQPTVGAHEYAAWLHAYAHDQDIVEQQATWLKIGRPSPPVPLEKPGENTMATTEIATVAMTRDETSALIRTASVRGRTSGTLETVIAALIPILDNGSGRMKTNMIGHGRHGLPGQPQVRRTAGWLSTRYPVNLEITPGDSLLAQRDSIGEQIAAVPMAGTGFGLLRYMNDDLSLREELAAIGEPDVTVNYQGRIRPTDPSALLQPAPESAGPDETSTGLREHVHGVDLIVDDGQFTVVWFFSTNQFSFDTITGYATELCDRLRSGLKL
ncbi:condensation domain-containing protein [Streptomyces sp. SP17KL33]|uniref:condensation domain-containing protein n=1 Tax=Streptomyces sp. SP17KL33 TaxID=3002534 RepID=UPI002E791F8B|nr:condensation domain-containing protein [Streptomyces sp. SP17KL33]MEE1831709.1 condensation domain-containing protein [Streptomyces sp. SP17KL33]